MPAATTRGLILGLASGLLVAALMVLWPGTARGTQFYVSPRGNDSAAGTRPSKAWRTMARVNRAALRPGDEVLFRGGSTFGRQALKPTASGSAHATIRYASYGRGRAVLRLGVYLRSVSWVELSRIHISGAAQGVAGAGDGAGARHITIENCVISDVGIGVNAPNAADRAWRIIDNDIVRTGDSGVIIQGSRFVVADNLIDRTGGDDGITYGKHGVYSKGPNTSILRNTITNFATEGVSTRYRNARIIGNRIAGGEGGVGYYADDPRSGLTVISDNRISGVEYGVYIAPSGAAGPTVERFRIRRNTATRYRAASDTSSSPLEVRARETESSRRRCINSVAIPGRSSRPDIFARKRSSSSLQETSVRRSSHRATPPRLMPAPVVTPAW